MRDNNLVTNQKVYRSDLDGLRAIAIIAVIINHFNKELLPSGYLGVDIFFVISGYVISSSIYRRENKNFLNFLTSFYARRLKRLIPALIFFIIVISVLVIIFSNYHQNISTTAISALFGFSNVSLFLKSTDYFGQSIELNPFAHTWSLGVEEQFYLLFPFLVWFSGFAQKSKYGEKYLFWVILFLSVLSLSLFYFLFTSDVGFLESAGYFLMPSRFWEIAAGSLVFLISLKYKRCLNFLYKFSNLIFLFLILLIFKSPYFIPSIATLLTVFFTSIIILNHKKNTLAYRFLTLTPFIYIGKISYSLYLWHWGILSISRWTVGVNVITFPIQLILIFLLSAISYHFIENPIRNSTFSKENYKNILGFFLTLPITSGFLLVIFRAFPRGIIFLPDIYSTKAPPKNSTYCTVYSKDWSFEKCLNPKLINEKTNIFYLIGDSHSLHFQEMVKGALIGTKYEFAFLHINRPNEFPYSLWARSKNWKESKILKYILDNSRKGDVVSFSFHKGWVNEYRDSHIDLLIKPRQNRRSKKTLKQLKEIFNEFKKKDLKIIVLKDTPLMKGYDLQLCTFQSKLFNTRNNCEVSVQQDLHTRTRQDFIYKSLDEYSILNKIEFYSWDPLPLFKKNNDFYSYFDQNQEYIMIDKHHISPSFSKSLIPNFKLFLLENSI